jgi:tryptophan synthase alpha chain
MNRIQNAFKNGKAFIGFVTGGDPDINASYNFIMAMIEGGADLVEIGIPFSDPIAEGPVIQAANVRALNNGAAVGKMFELAAGVRENTDVPLVFLTYLNPVYRRGYDRFFADCAASGVDGVIIPDLPFEESFEARPAAKASGVALISMVAPTSAERIGRISEQAEGFLYVVSSMGVTGVRSEIATDLGAMIELARTKSTVPACVGFGVSLPAQAAQIAKIADGVIVGSAIVKLSEKYGAGAAPYIRDYVRGMKNAII